MAKPKMQLNVRLSLAFLQLAVLLFIAFCENVVEMLTGNLSYTDPFPALADVTAKIDALKAAQQAAMDRSRVAIAARNQRWEELLGLMRQLAAWVQAHCQNSLEILATSGFNAVRSRTPVGPLPAPQTPTLKQGPNTGMLSTSTRRLRGSYTYCFRVALASAPTVYIQTVLTTSVRHTFEGLTPGQAYVVDVCGIGANGEGAYSPAVSHMVI
jgi:hypothetical protein